LNFKNINKNIIKNIFESNQYLFLFFNNFQEFLLFHMSFYLI